MRLGTRPRWREDGGQGKGQEKGESLPGLWKLCGKRGSDAAAVRWLQDGSILQVRSSNLARVASHRGSLGRVRSELPDRHHILTPTCINTVSTTFVAAASARNSTGRTPTRRSASGSRQRASGLMPQPQLPPRRARPQPYGPRSLSLCQTLRCCPYPQGFAVHGTAWRLLGPPW